ncbi:MULTISPECIES: FtsH protease activity modulator HflK [Sphingomonas]|uniref:FtsH protease activity modulator HflK n=1 Tax=Sphingomonas TaxID=13687 RepID=UPI000DEFD0EC|nr:MULTISPECIES: FtsH protease activity modulator HflK [Sphingomonas]
MTVFSGWGSRARGLFADNKSPWGPVSGPGEDEPPREGPRSPWSDPDRGGQSPSGGGATNSLEDLLRRGRERLGGGGGRSGGGGGFELPSGGLMVWVGLALVAAWLVFTSFHSIAPEERGVVTTLGRYNRTVGSGIGLTLPYPFERMQKVDVENIRNVDLGSTGTETLMLTGDQNIIDIAYSVRWNIRDPELYIFKLQNPDDTIEQVAESAMRAVIGTVTLNDAIGQRRGQIEAQVQENMQRILDHYQAGVLVQGVAIKQADPPAKVNEAFKDVTAAQQEAASYINSANAYSLQLRQKALGEAGAFDRIYAQYKLAPEVTRRRMYYETMENVLGKVDKTIIEAPGVTPYLPLPPAGRSATTPPAVQQGAAK